jgi:DNA-binding NarL/FixJ family response regulator
MLEPFADRIGVVELDSNLPPATRADMVLYDTYAMGPLDTQRLQGILANPATRCVVVYAWALTPSLITAAKAAGVHGVLSKGLSASELVAGLQRIHNGEFVVLGNEATKAPEQDPTFDVEGDWPGRAQGLTQRQSEVIALIHKGLSNQEIAEATYLSPNTVKSYIKAAYRTMGVTNRTQAILWSIDHGFDEDRTRLAPR